VDSIPWQVRQAVHSTVVTTNATTLSSRQISQYEAHFAICNITMYAYVRSLLVGEGRLSGAALEPWPPIAIALHIGIPLAGGWRGIHPNCGAQAKGRLAGAQICYLLHMSVRNRVHRSSLHCTMLDRVCTAPCWTTAESSHRETYGVGKLCNTPCSTWQPRRKIHVTSMLSLLIAKHV
jgi:hypothetical protein